MHQDQVVQTYLKNEVENPLLSSSLLLNLCILHSQDIKTIFCYRFKTFNHPSEVFVTYSNVSAIFKYNGFKAYPYF